MAKFNHLDLSQWFIFDDDFFSKWPICSVVTCSNKCLVPKKSLHIMDYLGTNCELI